MTKDEFSEYEPDYSFWPRDLSVVGFEVSARRGFSEKSLAVALRKLATDCREQGHLPDGALLAIADALDRDDAEWKLIIKRNKTGKKLPFVDKLRMRERDDRIARVVHYKMLADSKMESAVAHASEVFGVSRAVIFQSIKRESTREQHMRRLLADDPDIGLVERALRIDPSYRQYVDWLYRYSSAEGGEAY